MAKYIREQTVARYGRGNSGAGTFDLITIAKPEVCVWNILRYSLRNWNGRAFRSGYLSSIEEG
jgi:hypothetical protein